MIIRFTELIRLPGAEIYSYFQSPADWSRLYGLAGKVLDRGDGWYAVPLRRFPFPLVARVTAAEPVRLVRWVFKGFWDRLFMERGFRRIWALGWHRLRKQEQPPVPRAVADPGDGTVTQAAEGRTSGHRL